MPGCDCRIAQTIVVIVRSIAKGHDTAMGGGNCATPYLQLYAAGLLVVKQAGREPIDGLLFVSVQL